MQQQKSSLLAKAQFAFLLYQETEAFSCGISVMFLISRGVIGEIKRNALYGLSSICVFQFGFLKMVKV